MDKEMMRVFGEGMGEEFAGKGGNVMLAPMLILARVPQGGRNFESCGEDPELAYHFASNMISGVQSVPGVIANADDFVLNNQETDRGDISAVADQRTLFELYYRGYKGAIDANVGSFMCSYNRINGTHACENNITLGDLKNPQGLNFSGWVLSDWGGVHSTIPSALAGLDVEMPGSEFFGSSLLEAVVSGAVPMSLIDDKVLRILTPMFTAGLFDIPQQGHADSNVTSPRHTALARTLAAAGTVLLKNMAGLLPVPESTTSIVVFGSAAHDNPYCCGDGSGGLIPPYVIDPLSGISNRCGPSCNVTYIPSSPFFQNITQFYSASRGDHFLDFQCEECGGLYQEVRVEGFASEEACLSCVQLDLWWNPSSSGNLIIPFEMPPPIPGYTRVRPLGWVLPSNYSGPAETQPLELWQGKSTPVNATPGSHVDFWTLANPASRAEAEAAGYVKLATLGRVPLSSFPLPPPSPVSHAQLAIVVVATGSGEGRDRPTLALGEADQQLIVQACASYPGKTVVVINGPGAVLTTPWDSSDCGAILMQWYPGQEMGNALADVLWGDVNPSARLPVTFPAAEGDSPLQTPAQVCTPPLPSPASRRAHFHSHTDFARFLSPHFFFSQYPGVNGTVNYTEGLFIGYRWWDSTSTEPSFPFGHGLSYTTFVYSELKLDDSHPPLLGVSFKVTNMGGLLGKEVPQLYLGFPPGAGEPPLVLRDFTSILLSPGETGVVNFTLDARAYSVWDTGSYAWKVLPGSYQVVVGASSRDRRLQASFQAPHCLSSSCFRAGDPPR